MRYRAERKQLTNHPNRQQGLRGVLVEVLADEFLMGLIDGLANIIHEFVMLEPRLKILRIGIPKRSAEVTQFIGHMRSDSNFDALDRIQNDEPKLPILEGQRSPLVVHF